MNTKQFFSDTWHIAKDTYKTWFMYWWWFIGICLVARYFFPGLNTLNTTFLFGGFLFWGVGGYLMLTSLVGICAIALVLVTYKTLYLSAKPTIQPKDYAYFMRYIPHSIIMTIWFGVVTIIAWTIFELMRRYQLPELTGLAILGIVLVILILYVLALFSLLFLTALFESENIHLKEISMRAYKTLIHNIPILLGLSIVCVLAHFLFLSVMGSFALGYDLLPLYLYICFDFLFVLPLVIITATSIYYKRRY